jgi:hypothetical protein
MSQNIKGDFYTVEDIALARNITPQGVRKALKESRLKGKKIAGVWFISEEELKGRKWI